MTNTAVSFALAIALAGLAAGGAAASAAEVKSAAANRSFGDWVFRCAKTRTGEEACALHQKIMAADTKLPVAAFVLARNQDSKDLKLAAILPLGLDIPAGVSGTIGDAKLSFTVQTCVKRGCLASAPIEARLLAALGGKGPFDVTFRLRGVADEVTMPVSLKGLGEGLAALDGK